MEQTGKKKRPQSVGGNTKGESVSPPSEFKKRSIEKYILNLENRKHENIKMLYETSGPGERTSDTRGERRSPQAHFIKSNVRRGCRRQIR